MADPLSADQRPALTMLKDGIDEIRALLAIREPIYQQVKTMELNVAGKSIAQLIDEAIRTMGVPPMAG
jgi:shikimate kinase